MTDQRGNYPPQGDYGAWGQQPQHPQPQPGYRSQPAGPPPYPTQPYAPQPGYGAPVYGMPGGPAGPGGPGAPVPAVGGGNRKGLLLGSIGVLVVAAAVLAYFLLAGGSSASASTPKDAVKKLLDAGKSLDIDKAKKALCRSDVGLGGTSRIDTSDRIVTYTIGNEAKENGVTTVEATMTTAKNPQPATAKFPVVKEGGSWRVCFTKALAAFPSGFPTASGPTDSGVPTDSGIPTDSGVPTGPTDTTGSTDTSVPSDTGFPTDLPTDLPGAAGICGAAKTGYEVATTYIGTAEIGATSIAKSCVYRNSVPDSVTSSLSGKLFGPDTTDASATEVEFRSVDGSTKITVTTAKKSDGRYYVTEVKVG